MNSPPIDTGYRGGLLDALITLSRNVRLLIAGPLIVAALVVGVLQASPAQFTSHAIVVLAKPPVVEAGLLSGPGISGFGPTALQATTVMKSAVVLDQVLLSLYPGSGTPGDAARDALAYSIKTNVVKDSLIRLEVTSATALEAQKIANLVIDAWLKTTKPAAQQQAELEKRLAHAKETLLITQAILSTQKNALMSLVGLGELLDRYFGQTLEIERQMNGLTRDVVVQPPTLPTRPVEPPYLIIFFQVVLGAALFFVMWVLGRRALEAAKADTDTAVKLAELRNSLGGDRSKENSV